MRRDKPQLQGQSNGGVQYTVVGTFSAPLVFWCSFYIKTSMGHGALFITGEMMLDDPWILQGPFRALAKQFLEASLQAIQGGHVLCRGTPIWPSRQFLVVTFPTSLRWIQSVLANPWP